MWDWLRRRARPRRSRTSATNEDHSEPFPGITPDVTRPIRASTHPFFTPTLQLGNSPPKCLSRLPCSEILYGARLEDFSTDCWLEDHLHRFGLPDYHSGIGLGGLSSERVTSDNHSQLFDDADDESVTGSSESEDTAIQYSMFSVDIYDTLEMARERSRPRLALEELFVPPGERDNIYGTLSAPPPYSPFPADPPPSYEEAIGPRPGSDRRSVSSRSTSSSQAFMW